ncbi:transposase [Ferroacidibacillus organovorans]|uniref:Transposase n=1 Tax=Ferroacidibacillus organovorans TaxID=1765683 RepID=A0A853K9K5_9BACL|nr:transposase [Ferroacidibacillus organovorans]KYP81791.1 transposase [Ferroacidibacillus organovorans]OAG93715.1 transposase [Ferroacidibacillus organovorans]
MRVYDKEFKEEALKLSYEIGPTAASEQLGVPPTTLYTWRGQSKKHGSLAFVGSGHQRIDPKTAEMKGLEKKIRELESANDILKKALAFFAESQKR